MAIISEMSMADYITYFVFIAAFTTSFLLVILIYRHIRTISRGITSVERLLHKDYARQCREQNHTFVNPYDFGVIENWKRFLNVYTFGEFVRRVLFPSTHKPRGNGIIWSGCNDQTYLQTHRSDSRLSVQPLSFPPEAYRFISAAYPNRRYLTEKKIQ